MNCQIVQQEEIYTGMYKDEYLYRLIYIDLHGEREGKVNEAEC